MILIGFNNKRQKMNDWLPCWEDYSCGEQTWWELLLEHVRYITSVVFTGVQKCGQYIYNVNENNNASILSFFFPEQMENAPAEVSPKRGGKLDPLVWHCIYARPNFRAI